MNIHNSNLCEAVSNCITIGKSPMKHDRNFHEPILGELAEWIAMSDVYNGNYWILQHTSDLLIYTKLIHFFSSVDHHW